MFRALRTGQLGLQFPFGLRGRFVKTVSFRPAFGLLQNYFH